jgi:hypothetical protein
MLCELGSGPSSSDGAASSTDHNGSLGTDDSSGFYDRSAHSDYNEGSGPGCGAVSDNAKQSGTNPDRTGAAGKSQHSCGALPNFNGNADSPERSCSGPGTKWYDRRCA